MITLQGGEPQFSGYLSDLTSATGFSSKLLNVHKDATHYVRYTSASALTYGVIISGLTATASDNAGDTTSGSDIITGMGDTSDFFVGHYVTCSAGFASTSTRYKILSKTDSTITLNIKSNSTQSNITVNQYPTFRIVDHVVEAGTVGGGTATGILLVNDVRGTQVAGNCIVPGGTDDFTIGEGLIQIKFTNAFYAMITIETAEVTMCLDGSTPTVASGTSVGHRLVPYQSLMINGPNSLKNFKAINTVGSSGATIKYTLFFA